jgi:hypothetical protein
VLSFGFLIKKILNKKTNVTNNFSAEQNFQNAITIAPAVPQPLGGGLTLDLIRSTIYQATFQSYGETLETLSIDSAGTLILDLSKAQVFFVELNKPVTTLSIINAPDGPPSTKSRSSGFTLILKTNISSVFNINWGSSIKWANGIQPTLSSAQKTDIFSFVTVNNAGTWYGFIGGQGYPA